MSGALLEKIPLRADELEIFGFASKPCLFVEEEI